MGFGARVAIRTLNAVWMTADRINTPSVIMHRSRVLTLISQILSAIARMAYWKAARITRNNVKNGAFLSHEEIRELFAPLRSRKGSVL